MEKFEEIKENYKYLDVIEVDEFKKLANIETNIEGYYGNRFCSSCFPGEPEIVINGGMIRLGTRWSVAGHYEQ